MNYFLTINGQPPFPCDDLTKTLAQIGEAIQKGYLHRTDAAGTQLYIKLGAGSILALVSEEAMQEKRKEKRDDQQRAQGLIIPGSVRKEAWPWRLIVQLHASGSIVQLEPIPYETEAAAVAAVERALSGEVIRQTTEEGHDYVWVFPGPNVNYLVMSYDNMLQQQRLAMDMHRRMASAQMGKQLGGLPKIVR